MTSFSTPGSASEGRDQQKVRILWCVASQSIVVEELSENEFALFNPAFSDSTVLNAIDACLLRILADRIDHGMLEEDLVKSAALALDLPNDHLLNTYVRESLAQMEQMGLLVSHVRAE